MRHPEFPVISFLSILLLACCLPSHIRARSVSVLALIAWLAVMSIIRGVNSIIWSNNVIVRLEVWCDITTKIVIGFTYAVPGCALCILRHLESVASTRSVITTWEDKRRRRIFEIIMCFGIPILFMALHYIVQGHRFDIIEDVGCVPFVYFSVASVIIIWVPPFLMSLVSFVYAALVIRHFLRHRIEFTAHLRHFQSAISPGRYLRLMAMALFEMIWDTGVNAYLIYFNTFTGLRPWISWENVHSNFSRVATFPEVLIPPEFISQVIWQWWIVPISCITFFLFFGFGEEALSDYRSCFKWLRGIVWRQDMWKPSSYGPSLPVYRASSTISQIATITLPGLPDDNEKTGWGNSSFKMSETSSVVSLPTISQPKPPNCAYPYDISPSIPTASSSNLSSPTLTPPVLTRHLSYPSMPNESPSPPPSPLRQETTSQLSVDEDTRPSCDHRSTLSSAYEIDISPAHFPESRTSLQHDEVDSTATPSNSAHRPTEDSGS